MKTLKFDNKEKWLNARIGKITGTRLKDLISLRSTTPKKGFYELIAERLAIPSTDENPMDRGSRLEEEAIARFAKETGKKVDGSLIMWISEENESMAISPDGVIGKTEAVEVKCLNSASHIEAYLTQKLPSEYQMQIYQYFIINDKLKTLYFAFYDPRLEAKDFFYLTIKREEVIEEVIKYHAEQLKILAEVERIVLELSPL